MYEENKSTVQVVFYPKILIKLLQHCYSVIINLSNRRSEVQNTLLIKRREPTVLKTVKRVQTNNVICYYL